MKKLFANLFGHTERRRLTRPTRAFRPRVEGLEERSLMTVGLEFHINSDTFLDQHQVAVASQPVANGRSVAVWTSQRDLDGRNTDLKAQLYDGFGSRIGGEITVANSIYNEREASVAMDAFGSFVVVWTEDVVIAGGDTMIRGQRFFASGARNGGVMTLANNLLLKESDPDVAMDTFGSFVVSHTVEFTPTNHDVLARRFSSNGASLGSIFVATTSSDEQLSSVARSPDGRFSVAYQTDQSFGGLGGFVFAKHGIVLKRYSAAGGLLGRHDITSSFASVMDPDVAMDRFGNSVVVYEGAASAFNHNILARKVFSNGV